MERMHALVIGALIAAGGCRDSLAPAVMFNADLTGTVRNGGGTPVAATRVVVTCGAGQLAGSATTSSAGDYQVHLTLSDRLLSSTGSGECQVEAPDLPGGAVTKRVTVQFYPPATPHALQGVNLP